MSEKSVMVGMIANTCQSVEQFADRFKRTLEAFNSRGRAAVLRDKSKSPAWLVMCRTRSHYETRIGSSITLWRKRATFLRNKVTNLSQHWDVLREEDKNKEFVQTILACVDLRRELVCMDRFNHALFVAPMAKFEAATPRRTVLGARPVSVMSYPVSEIAKQMFTKAKK